METIKTIFQALILAIVATVIVGTLSSIHISQSGSISFDAEESSTVQTPNLDASQTTSLNSGLPQE